MSKIRVFVDMDGTIARFYEDPNCLERMNDEGFFASLNPYESVVQAIRRLTDEAEVIFISAVSREANTAISDKKDWLKRYFGDCRYTTLFPAIGENKAELAKTHYGQLSASDVLLDDYNRNLEEWAQAGGRSVKLINEINNKGLHGKLWTGSSVRYDASPAATSEYIRELAG